MAAAKKKILIQLDIDQQPSVFDAVVAVDAEVDHLFRHGNVKPEIVRDLIHGAMFTRGPADLRSTAVFIGGSNVDAAEAVFDAVLKTFFGPFRVSILFDPNGSNTTAAAAVVAALEGFGDSVAGIRAVVLGGTGPVGGRVARLLAGLGANVAVGSRLLDRAKAAADRIAERTKTQVDSFSSSDPSDLANGLKGASLVVAAGAAGAVLLPKSIRTSLADLNVMIDLNAVPPLGIEGVEATDKAKDRDGVRAWGALGVGGIKMKIHKAALRSLFESNDAVIDAEQALQIGRGLGR